MEEHGVASSILAPGIANMIIHVALFKWKPEVASDDADQVISDIRALKEKIPEITSVYAGKNFSKSAKDYTHAVVVTFNNREGLQTYRNHPMHQPIADLCDRMEADSVGFDFDSG